MNVDSSQTVVDAHMLKLKVTYKMAAAYLLICAIKENDFGLGVKVELYSKVQAHYQQCWYYWFVVAFVCVDYSRSGIYTYKGVETDVPLNGGEDNATKVYALALEKMASLQTALELSADELAEEYRNYFFTYCAPQVSPAAAEAAAEDEAAGIGE